MADDMAPATAVTTQHRTTIQRTLEVAALTFHSLCIPLFALLFLYLGTIRLLWPLLIPYTISLYFFHGHESGTSPLRSTTLRALPIWSFFAAYFPATLHRCQPLDPNRKYIFGYHPHGIIAHGAFLAFSTDALSFSRLFPGLTSTLLTLDTNFRIPLYREYILALGLASVSQKSCRNLLRRGGPRGDGSGRAITIVVGGARESMIAAPKTLRLMVRDRKGVVKLALRAGALLVPVLGVGENDLYSRVNAERYPLVPKVQRLVKKATGWEMPLFYGDWGLLAYRTPVDIVVGRPIEVGRAVEEPDGEEIDRVHGLYVKELERMWEEWRGKLPAAEGVELEFF